MDELYLDLMGTSKKKTVSYTIDENLLKEFDVYSKAKKLKKSQIVERMIKLFIEQEKSLLQ